MTQRARPDVVLDQRLSVALAADELDRVRQSAAALGLTVSSYIRTAALGTATMPPQRQAQHLMAGGAVPQHITP